MCYFILCFERGQTTILNGDIVCDTFRNATCAARVLYK